MKRSPPPATDTRIAWITNLPSTAGGGGTYAVNYHSKRSLARHFRISDNTPIPIAADWIPAFTSKVKRRVFGLRGSFPVFSGERLRQNARQIDGQLNPSVDLVYFKGVTPWSLWKADRPYVIYTDVALHTFFHNTFDPANFLTADLERIWHQERDFMAQAGAVFFESRWGMEATRSAYQMNGDNFFAVGRGGNLTLPETDCWDGRSLNLLTIAKHFRQKGGDMVREAYLQLKTDYPNLRWHIVGGPPDFDWSAVEGVSYEGFLNVDNPRYKDRLVSLYQNGYLLMHPTREDTNPLVITEAASFGCPCVSVRRFAIPELIADQETGILVDWPATPELLANAIAGLLKDPARYQAMRRAARTKGLEQGNWGHVGDRMAEEIGKLLRK